MTGCASTTGSGSTTTCWRTPARPTRCCGARGALHRNADYAPDAALQGCNRPLPGNPGAVTYRSASPRISPRPVLRHQLRRLGGVVPGRNRGPAIGRHRVGQQQLDVHRRRLPALLLARRPTIWSVRRATAAFRGSAGRANGPGAMRPRQPRPVPRQRHLGPGTHPHHRQRHNDSGVLRFDPSAGPTGKRKQSPGTASRGLPKQSVKGRPQSRQACRRCRRWCRRAPPRSPPLPAADEAHPVGSNNTAATPVAAAAVFRVFGCFSPS